MTDLRQPTIQEQMVIVEAYRALGYQTKAQRPILNNFGERIVAIALGSELKQDDSGEWTTMFGLPVITDA